MAEAIIMISAEIEHFFYPVSQGNFSVGPVPADHEDDWMEKNKSIDEIGKLKFSVGYCQYYEGNKSRYDFQKPCEIVMGFYAGNNQCDKEYG